MLKLDNVTVLACDDTGNSLELTRLIGKKYGYRKYPVPEDKSLLNYR